MVAATSFWGALAVSATTTILGTTALPAALFQSQIAGAVVLVAELCLLVFGGLNVTCRIAKGPLPGPFLLGILGTLVKAVCDVSVVG